MKITIEHPDAGTITLERKGVVVLPEVLELFEDVLKGLGYSFEGQLDIVSD